MSFLNLMTNTVVISRLTAVSRTKSAFATVTAEYVNIQRMDDKKTVQLGGAIGKMFRLYAGENADIEKGDRLRDENGSEYNVVAVSIPAELGAFIHKEITLIKTQ